MPKIDLGKVVGADGGFGNISANYENDGGEPSVDIAMSGPDTAKDVTFTFRNLVNDPITSSEIEQVTNDNVLNSSNTLNATGLTTLWQRIKAKFAPKAHTHSASDITAGQLAAALIANGTITADMLQAGAVGTTAIAADSVTSDKLAPAVRDSLSRFTFRDDGLGIKTVRFSANDSGTKAIVIVTLNNESVHHLEF